MSTQISVFVAAFFIMVKAWRQLQWPAVCMFSSGGPSVRFLTRYDGEVSEPLVGRQGSRVSMRVARVERVIARESW